MLSVYETASPSRRAEIELSNKKNNAAAVLDSWSYGCLVKQCQELAQGKLLHRNLSTNGYGEDRYVANLLVEMYARLGSIEDAVAVFDSIHNKNVFSWNIVIAAYARHGYLHDAVACFRRMQCEGTRPDKCTFSTILGPLSALRSLSDCRQIHTHLQQQQQQSDGVVSAALLHAYGKCGSLEEAESVLVTDSEMSSDVWNALIAAFVSNGFSRRALDVFLRMHLMGVRPDKYSFSSALAACTALKDLVQGRSLHVQICCCGLESNEAIAVALVEMLGKYGSADEAHDVFRRAVSQGGGGLAVWNAMLAAFARNGRVSEALLQFDLMLQSGNSDRVSWTTLITALAQNGDPLQALKLFSGMDLEGVKPDRVTFVGVLDACSRTRSIVRARVAHQRVVDCGFEASQEIGNALVNMYAKCGGLKQARSLFASLRYDRDVISWSSMIEAFAAHGLGDEALEHFHGMQQDGVDPNAVTFLSVLSACRHSGLLEEALRSFGCMVGDYGMKGDGEHCACVVDLLGRAGRLAEAKEFIELGNYSEGEVAWTSFLVGCHVHGDLQEAGKAVNRVTNTETAAMHVLLSNIVAPR